ncbi:unnamed protein product, partial [Iphiclides podalirius]
MTSVASTMFKLVVLSALLIAVAAEPGFFSAPLAPVTYAATVAAPSTTTYVQSSSYIAPTVYSSLPYPHFIKKRSAEADTAAEDAAPQTAHNKRSVLLAEPALAPAAYGPAYIASAPSGCALLPAIIPSASYYPSYYPSYYAGYPAAVPLIKK